MSQAVPEQQPSFTGNPDLERKKQDIADRSYRLSMISTVISIATAAAGFGLMVLAPGVGGLIGGAVIGLGGPLITTMVTKREQEKLALDRQYLETQMQGGNWGDGHWKGYAEHVAKAGYASPQAPGAFGSSLPHQHVQRKPGKGGFSPA